MAEIDAPSRTTPIVLWVLRALMAALFLFSAYAKLASMQMEVDAFAMLPVGQWFRYLVGLLELAGGTLRAHPDDFRARRDCVTCGRCRGVFRPDPIPASGLDSSHRHRSDPRRPHLPAARRHSRTIGNVKGWGCRRPTGPRKNFPLTLEFAALRLQLRKERSSLIVRRTCHIDSKARIPFRSRHGKNAPGAVITGRRRRRDCRWDLRARAGCLWLELMWGFPNRRGSDSTCWLGGGQQECRSHIRKTCATG